MLGEPPKLLLAFAFEEGEKNLGHIVQGDE
jgi:hypothetical protein